MSGAHALSFFKICWRTVELNLNRFGLSNYNPSYSPTLCISSLQNFSSCSDQNNEPSVQPVGFVFGSLLDTTEAAISNPSLFDPLGQLHLLQAWRQQIRMMLHPMSVILLIMSTNSNPPKHQGHNQAPAANSAKQR